MITLNYKPFKITLGNNFFIGSTYHGFYNMNASYNYQLRFISCNILQPWLIINALFVRISWNQELAEHAFENALIDGATSIWSWGLSYLIDKIHSANSLDNTKINEAELLPLWSLSYVCGSGRESTLPILLSKRYDKNIHRVQIYERHMKLSLF